MRFLDKDESWDLLRYKVFGDQDYYSLPPQLEKAGKKIAENCEGLPLTIVTVANLLSEAEKNTPYNFLPKYIEACFLYMGVFPRNHEITRTKLNELWIAEGFLHRNRSAPLEDLVTIIYDLVGNNLLMTHQRRFNYEMKTCSLHSSFWHLCRREASTNKFSHVIKSKRDGLSHAMKSQRRLRLLRVVDALAVHFYEFPMEVVKLVLLRYLELWNLQFLIVRQHSSIIKSSSRLYLPREIWDMKKLKHLQIMGSDLPDPCGARLPNLVTLLDVSPHSCTKSILDGVPNLTKLGIRLESTPENSNEPLSCFDHISHLDKLESLKCVVVNPILGPEPINALLPSIFPTSLIKLSLSGFGYPWEDMRVIASLPNLEVLKLRCYAFRGPKWVTRDGDFPELRFLLIEDTDLVQWSDTGIQSCRCLELLKFKHCYKLQEIPQVLGDLALNSIELDYCNPLAVACAHRITEDQLLTKVIARHLGS
ncbi:putative late blight resistance protein homolog r1a-4 [Phtheirospermum japonicum]|uniref:Putative late blight resistance protein homolog r1a-4 n=1 Tax=Phtheirospermum japonicum TaxID=374723 RepID=A0A830DER3_9LAMI|nr:putative late blight resistance protein homolog r1a-4 [Phtheirospermum japonicum]